MGIRYRKDIIAELKAAGWSTFRIQREKLLTQSTLQRLRNGSLISLESLGKICGVLKMQPGDLIEYKEEGE